MLNTYMYNARIESGLVYEEWKRRRLYEND